MFYALCNCGCVIFHESPILSSVQFPHLLGTGAELEAVQGPVISVLSGHWLRTTPGDFPFVKKEKKKSGPKRW